MRYSLEISEKMHKTFLKMKKRNKKHLEIIGKKIKAILDNPHQFKPLKGDMHGARRVHINRSFVLVYEVDEKSKMVRILDYDHHDKIY